MTAPISPATTSTTPAAIGSISLTRSTSISRTTVVDPGWPRHSNCKGASAAVLLNVQNSKIRYNSFTNNNRPWNRVDRAFGVGCLDNGLFEAAGHGCYSDLPSG